MPLLPFGPDGVRGRTSLGTWDDRNIRRGEWRDNNRIAPKRSRSARAEPRQGFFFTVDFRHRHAGRLLLHFDLRRDRRNRLLGRFDRRHLDGIGLRRHARRLHFDIAVRRLLAFGEHAGRQRRAPRRAFFTIFDLRLSSRVRKQPSSQPQLSGFLMRRRTRACASPRTPAAGASAWESASRRRSRRAPGDQHGSHPRHCG